MAAKKGTCPTFYAWCQTTGSDLLKEWVSSSDPKVTPETVTIGSEKMCITWRCEKNHEYPASVNRRVSGQGCPYCKGKRVLKGFNDLASQYPNVAKEWDSELNDLKPDEIVYGSNKRARWKCEKGHKWEAIIKSRTIDGCKCPYCAGQRAIPGENDLQTLYPKIAAEWHPTKNGNVKSSEVSGRSNRPYYWLCMNGHTYRTTPDSRVRGRGCPTCAAECHVSFNEKAIAYYLSRDFLVEESAHPKGFGKSELDIFLPEYNIGIEYDGRAYHKSSARDVRKNELCVKSGIRLFRIREPGCPPLSGCDIIELKSLAMPEIEKGIRMLMELIGKETNQILDSDINLKRDGNDILEKKSLWRRENSLAATHPEIASEWHPTKNGNLRPEMFKTCSNRKFWWQCEEGHEWSATIRDRTLDHTGCPVCRGKKIIPGYNDFKTRFPEMAKYWDYSKNEKGPEEYAPFSNKRVWWKCDNGHSYPCSINNKAKGKGCLQCWRERGRKKTL